MVIETLTSSEQTHILNLVKDVLGETNMNAAMNEVNIDNEAKPTQQELFDRYVNLYHEQATIGLDIKALTEEFKEFYPDEDLTTIKQVAKSKAEESLCSKIDKALKFKEIVETFC
jgi:hypothetical protein